MNNIKSLLMTLVVGILMGSVVALYVAVRYEMFNGSSELEANKKEVADSASLKGYTRLWTAVDLDLSPVYVEDEIIRNGHIRRVKKVKDAVELRDGELVRSEIKRIFANDPVLADNKIGVKVRKGKVTLFGEKLPPGYIGRAVMLAYNVDDVISVTSTMEIKPRRKQQ